MTYRILRLKANTGDIERRSPALKPRDKANSKRLYGIHSSRRSIYRARCEEKTPVTLVALRFPSIHGRSFVSSPFRSYGRYRPPIRPRPFYLAGRCAPNGTAARLKEPNAQPGSARGHPGENALLCPRPIVAPASASIHRLTTIFDKIIIRL